MADIFYAYLKDCFLWSFIRNISSSCCSWSSRNAFFWSSLQFLTSNAILHRKLFSTAEFLVLPQATMQTGPAHWLPFHQGGGGVRWGRGECRTEWQVVVEPWESHWLTGWKLNTGLWFCLTAGVSLLPWGRGPFYWLSWYPSPSQSLFHMDFSWPQPSLKRCPCVIDLNVHLCRQQENVFCFSNLPFSVSCGFKVPWSWISIIYSFISNQRGLQSQRSTFHY